MPDITLYAAKGSCSICTQIALEEGAFDYKVVYVELFSERRLIQEINPKGKVPALMRRDGSLMTQSTFILPWIADARPDLGLLGAPGTALREERLQWLGFFNSDVHPAFRALHRASLCRSDVRELAGYFFAALESHFKLVDRTLADSEWLTGDTFSIADIYAGACFSWARKRLDNPEERFPAYARAWRAFESRPSVRNTRHIEATTESIG